MKLGASLALLALVAGCTPKAQPGATGEQAGAAAGEPAIEAVAQFDGELGVAKERRRVVALASPT